MRPSWRREAYMRSCTAISSGIEMEALRLRRSHVEAVRYGLSSAGTVLVVPYIR